jgi:uncharacterized protein (UPF0332 family)
MTEDQLELLEEARDSLAAAKYLLDGGFYGYSASRAYYSMFNVVQAFLEGEGRAYSKHSAVISAFGQYFAHTGRVPVEFHRYLIDAEEIRLKADYTAESVSPEEAEEQIAHAEEFLELAERLIGPIPPEQPQE